MSVLPTGVKLAGSSDPNNRSVLLDGQNGLELGAAPSLRGKPGQTASVAPKTRYEGHLRPMRPLKVAWSCVGKLLHANGS